MIYEKVLWINSYLHLRYLLLPMRLTLLVFCRLIDYRLLLIRICPYNHTEHPLDVWQTGVVKPCRLLSLLYQCCNQQVEGFDAVPVSPLPLWYGMRLTTFNPQVLAFRLYEV